MTKKATLIVGHGSRYEYNKKIMELQKERLEKMGLENVYIGFNETSQPFIGETGIYHCVYPNLKHRMGNHQCVFSEEMLWQGFSAFTPHLLYQFPPNASYDLPAPCMEYAWEIDAACCSRSSAHSVLFHEADSVRSQNTRRLKRCAQPSASTADN